MKKSKAKDKQSTASKSQSKNSSHVKQSKLSARKSSQSKSKVSELLSSDGPGFSPCQESLVEPNRSIMHSKKSSVEKETLELFLGSYEKVLNERLAELRNKWNEVQVLEKNLSSAHITRAPNQQLAQVEGEFYIQKITNLQRQLKQKQQEVKQLKAKQAARLASTPVELLSENKRVRQQNQLLLRENRVLKAKLREAGFL